MKILILLVIPFAVFTTAIVVTIRAVKHTRRDNRKFIARHSRNTVQTIWHKQEQK